MGYKEKSVELLNKAVAEELLACHQYMYFHFRLEDAGYSPLAQLFHKISIVEMRHIELLAERILFLGGDVDMKPAGSVSQLHDVGGMLECAAEMETSSVEEYNSWARICSDNGDSATKTIFESLVVVEEEHQDIFETELANLRDFGEKYLALQAHEHSKEVAK